MAETDELTETGAQAELGEDVEREDVEREDVEQDAEEPRKELDPETRARRDAALRHVRKLGDPVLRASALPVDRFDEALREEIERMGELMGEALGIGLAATQIGVLHRVLVYRADPEDPLTVLVNPVLEWSSEEMETASEGCLSIPFVHVDVERPAEVRVRARDGYGAELKVHGSGLTARVIQHEMDHLDGILMIDRISREERKEAMRAMREAQREASEPGGGARVAGEAGEQGQAGGDGGNGDAGKPSPGAGEGLSGADEAVPDASPA